MSTDKACPIVESDPLSDFFVSYYYLIAIPCFLFGMLLILFGGRNPTSALFVMTMALVGTILLYAIYAWIPAISPWWLVFYVAFMSYGNGAVLGFGSTLSPRIGVTICGAAFGLFTGFVIDMVIVNRFVE